MTFGSWVSRAGTIAALAGVLAACSWMGNGQLSPVDPLDREVADGTPARAILAAYAGRVDANRPPKPENELMADGWPELCETFLQPRFCRAWVKLNVLRLYDLPPFEDARDASESGRRRVDFADYRIVYNSEGIEADFQVDPLHDDADLARFNDRVDAVYARYAR